MKQCACGCGQEVQSKKAAFLPGHASKLRSKKNKEQVDKIILQSQSDPAGAFSTSVSPSVNPTIHPADDTHKEEKKEQKRTKLYFILIALFVFAGALQYYLISWLKISWVILVILWVIDLIILGFLLYTVWRLRKLQEPVIFEDMEDFVKQVPKWAIKEKSPKSGIVGSILNKGKNYKQIVLFSEHFEPNCLWAEWDGFLFRIGNRAYKPPRDVRGDIFPYHVDKKQCLIDVAKATQEDAEDSYHELAIWNQAFSVGHAAALNETQQQIRLILVLVVLIFAALIIFALYTKGQFDGINDKFIIAQKLIEQMAAEGVKTKP